MDVYWVDGWESYEGGPPEPKTKAVLVESDVATAAEAIEVMTMEAGHCYRRHGAGRMVCLAGGEEVNPYLLDAQERGGACGGVDLRETITTDA